MRPAVRDITPVLLKRKKYSRKYRKANKTTYIVILYSDGEPQYGITILTDLDGMIITCRTPREGRRALDRIMPEFRKYCDYKVIDINHFDMYKVFLT